MITKMDKLTATKEALKITENCLTYIQNILKPGLTEKKVSLLIKKFFLENGADDISFETIVCSGKRTALFHGPTSSKKIQRNEPVYIDLGCKYHGYCSDLTRMFFLGQPDADFLKIYHLVKKVQSTQEKALQPNLSVKKLDLIGRDIFRKHNLDQYFVHSTGHGIGKKVHQKPTISYKRNGVLKEGTIFTIEPGLYLPNTFGVRIEDMYLITTTGYQRLSKGSRELTIID